MIVLEVEEVGYRRQFRHFATQYASAISQIPIDGTQWVGRLIRVYGSLRIDNGGNEESVGLNFGGEERAVELAMEKRAADAIAEGTVLPAGDITREEKDRAAAGETTRLLDFLTRQEISDIAISDVTYEIDTDDTEGLHYFAKGIIDIKESKGDVLAAGKRYSFRHRIKATYHTRETILTEVGPIPKTAMPVNEEPPLV